MRKPTTTVAVTLAMGLALTACSSAPQSEAPAETTPGDVTSSAPQPIEATDPPEEPEPDGYSVGQIVTAEPGDLEPSQRAFPLPDGTFVIVDRYEPVPEQVQTILNEQATATIPYEVLDEYSMAAENRAGQGASDMRAAATMATGKDVVVVYRLPGLMACDGSGAMGGWKYTGGLASFHDGCAVWGTREQAIAGAQAYVASKADPGTYLIVAKNG